MTDYYKSDETADLTEVELVEDIKMAYETGIYVEKYEAIAYQIQPQEIEISQTQTNKLPLSFAQTRLWFLDQLQRDHTSHNISVAVRLTGLLDIAALKRSLNEIVRRHENLRTTFPTVDGEPVQVIAPTLSLTLPVIDWQKLPEDEQSVEMQWLLSEEAQQPFDLSTKPLLRATLLRLGEQSYVLLIVMHQIVSDRWSMKVLIDEIAALYQTYATGKSSLENGKRSPLPELAMQYADFVHWQRQHLTQEVLETKLAYWKQQLADASPLLELPTDRPRSVLQTFRGAKRSFVLPKPLTESLKALSQQSGVSLFTTILTAFKTLLHRYTGQEDIVVGSPFANRNLAETQHLIGLFVNTLVLRTQIQGNLSFTELLKQVQEMTQEAEAHQDLPFEKLLEELQPERTLSHTPLFQVMFVWENNPVRKLELPGLAIAPLELQNVTAKFELTLSMEETESGLEGAWEYNTDLFDQATIVRMGQHLENLLAGIVANPQQPIAQIPLLSAAETQQLLIEWNHTQQQYPLEQCFPQLFEQQVARTPDVVAVKYENQQLTYLELNARANQWARHLVEQGVGAETIVGILCDRHIDFLTAMLAIFKAGGAYLPLNIDHPVERTQQILAQSQIPFVIAANPFEPIITSACQTLATPPQILLIAQIEAQQHSSQNLPVRTQPDHLAYVIYTSGSTGTPKGAMLEHRGMLNHLYAKVTDLQLTATDTVAQIASVSFDISIWQFLAVLLVGGRVEIISNEIITDPAKLLAVTQTQEISILEIVPSLLRMMLKEIELLGTATPQLSQLRWLLLTGEALPPQLCRRWLEFYPTIPMMNAYGPTECSDDVTHYAIHQPPAADVLNLPIGRPVANTQLYVLDSHLQPVPIGVAGELYVGGVGVGRGYLHNPQLTQAVFIPNPFAQTPGERLYKTGDLVRMLADGNIEFLGRIDFQVKIRGNRIELGEIEAVLNQHADVDTSVVIARVDENVGQHLVAYVVANSEIVTAHQLREYLKAKLPGYMVPNALMLLPNIPLTPNGKVDRKALPVPDLQLGLTTNFVAASTPTQEVLANLWAEILGLEKVGIHDNFFELGGHSLLATQVISRLRSLFGVDLPLRRLFEQPTIAQLGELIEAVRQSDLGLQAAAIKPVSRNADLPLSFAQARLWFLDQLEGGSATYNMPESLRLTGSLNVAALQMAVQAIVDRHEVLHTTFKMVNDSPVQAIADDTTVTIPVVDLQHLPEVEQSATLKQLASQEAQRTFDLSNGLLLRVTLVRLNEQSHVLLLVMHHIVSDGWSMGIFIEELSSLYEAFCAGKPSSLPELPIQYADFAAWQREWLSGEVLQTQLNYWKQHLAGAPPLLELPTDRPRPPIQTFRGSTEYFQLNQELTQQLKTLSQQSGVTLFMSLLAAFNTLMYRYTGQEDIVIGSPIANRNRSELEPLIGFFVNTLVLRTQLQGNPTFTELLERVREITLGGYEHQDLPFEKLVEELQPERSLSHTPLFQVMFVLQNAPTGKLELPGLTLTPFEQENTTAKFDLTLSMTETATGLTGELVYNTNLFDAATIKRMAENFQTLLTSIVANPQQRIAQLPLLSAVEKHQLLVEWNDTQIEYPDDKCIHQLFEQQVAQTPDAVAAVFVDAHSSVPSASGRVNQQLTYRELDARANQLAHYLQTLGVKPDVLVGICVEPSLEMVVGLLGILKAGGAYVPLDPKYPQERLSFMLNDSQVPVLLTQQKLAADLPEHGACVVCLDTDWGIISQESEEQPISDVQASNLAYVIYTSGSTGKPKGVLVAHRGLCNLAQAQIRIFDVQPNSRVLQFASFSFDASISEVVMTLCAGAQLSLATRDSLLPGPALIQLLQNQGITHTTLSPSVLATMPTAELPDWQTIIVAGEACSPDLVTQWSGGRRFFNAYGPTESTVCATTALCTDGNSAPPIGRPIANTQIYILDCHLQPVPIGVPGELHIGSVGLARGYLNRPELTQEKFIPNPFSKEEGSRLYKTGDLARYRNDGNIEFLGRIDHQVKIRGLRIELGEIEAILSQHPLVQEAVVIPREDQPGNKRLVAYIVSKLESPSTSELRSLLKEKLPEYMVPSAFVMLESLPLTPNGKVDRKVLPAPEQANAELESTFVAPRTPIEQVLADIWAEILGLEQVGIHHNFFELGGHSLMATQVISRIHDFLEVELPLRTLFERQTVAELAVSVFQSLAQETEQEDIADILAELEEV